MRRPVYIAIHSFFGWLILVSFASFQFFIILGLPATAVPKTAFLAPGFIGLIVGALLGNSRFSINAENRNLESIVKRRTEELEIANKELKRENEQRKKTEKSLIIEKSKAENASLAKGQFLANMSHEIRTPLNAIIGFSDIVLSGSEKLSSVEILDYLRQIQIGGQNLLALLTDILDLSKIESGKMLVIEEPLKISSLLEVVYRLNQAQALKKKLKWSYQIDESLPEFMISDSTKLNQILVNLVNNAMKFTESGKSVYLDVVQEADWIVFNIVDEGIGIPASRQQSIFENFEQADSSTTRKYGGTGLGLAIVKHLTHLLKGQVSLKSQEEQPSGTTVSVRIPLKSILVSEVFSEIEWIEEHLFSEDNRVLVVEDNPLNQAMMKALFDILGLKIEIANNGKGAVEKMKIFIKEDRLPHLILMDLHMPEMNGFEAFETIRSLPGCEAIPIVAQSADAFIDRAQDTIALGFFDYLTKPIDRELLTDLLKKVLILNEESP